MYFIARILSNRAYASRFGERLGFLPRSFHRTNSASIWLHAVSVGEVASATPLIQALRSRDHAACVYLSTSTIAGRRAAEHHAAPLVDGIFFAPLDYVSCIRRVSRAICPSLLIVLETEIWPNLYAQTQRYGARIVIANGRISARAWPRYRATRRFFAPILNLPSAVFVQSSVDYDRYAALGVPLWKLYIAGNLKYDVALPVAPVNIPIFGARQIWVAASTVGPNERGSFERHSIDEDEIVIRTFQALQSNFPRLLLVLAPRQPGRFDEVARKLQRSGVHFVRRSSISGTQDSSLELPGVLLLDTVGELASVFRLANVAFIGGSIAPRGGHNILEPAAAGIPIVIGPYMQNFEAVVRDFLGADALVQIQREDQLLPALRGLLLDPTRAEDLGKRARKVVEQHRGASTAIADQLIPLYRQTCLPTHAHGFFSRFVLTPAAWLWQIGGALRRRRAERHAASLPRLPAPIVSIGGITVGGSGKTPFANYLAARCKERGYFPAILSRGYHRRSPAPSVVLAPGSKVPPAMTGDEAQILLRAGNAPIGIGADRYETAKILLDTFPSTDLLLLDDGFQHAKIYRDFDIVVIDGLDPFGHEELVPLGRLREPLNALERANAFIVTRCESDFRYEVIRARLREFNPAAPVFRTRLVPRHWRDYRTEISMLNLGARRVATFCGLGNPQNFWNTLESLGLEIVFRWSFEDHHRYKPVELQRIAHQALAHGAQILVTTEKDRINCPAHLDNVIAPFSLAWLEIDLELENESAFFAVMEQNIRRRSAAPPAQ